MLTFVSLVSMIACAAVHSHRCRAANLHRPFLGLQGILHRLELCAELWAGVFLGDRLSYEIISRGGHPNENEPSDTGAPPCKDFFEDLWEGVSLEWKSLPGILKKK